MRSNVGAGVIAGLLVGVLFGLGMQMIPVDLPDGTQASIIRLIARMLGSENVYAGWGFHLVYNIIIGGLFGGLFGLPARGSYAHGLAFGLLFGVCLWVLSGLILMPLILSQPAFAPITDPAFRGLGFGSLVGHMAFGSVLGLLYCGLRHERIERIPERVVA